MNKTTTRYQDLVERLPVGVLIINNDKIDYANPHAVEMLGI
ncbi:MAG: PAS domain-containing protein, partial [Flavobacteriales bacterium]|nr:PAS domain-containing protein [Flavobacteriales bacterium]